MVLTYCDSGTTTRLDRFRQLATSCRDQKIHFQVVGVLPRVKGYGSPNFLARPHNKEHSRDKLIHGDTLFQMCQQQQQDPGTMVRVDYSWDVVC